LLLNIGYTFFFQEEARCADGMLGFSGCVSFKIIQSYIPGACVESMWKRHLKGPQFNIVSMHPKLLPITSRTLLKKHWSYCLLTG